MSTSEEREGLFFAWKEVELSYGNCSSKLMVMGMKIQSFVTKVEKLMDGSAKHRFGLTSSPIYQSTSYLFLFGLDTTGMSKLCSFSENYVEVLL